MTTNASDDLVRALQQQLTQQLTQIIAAAVGDVRGELQAALAAADPTVDVDCGGGDDKRILARETIHLILSLGDELFATRGELAAKSSELALL